MYSLAIGRIAIVSASMPVEVPIKFSNIYLANVPFCFIVHRRNDSYQRVLNSKFIWRMELTLLYHQSKLICQFEWMFQIIYAYFTVCTVRHK